MMYAAAPAGYWTTRRSSCEGSETLAPPSSIITENLSLVGPLPHMAAHRDCDELLVRILNVAMRRAASVRPAARRARMSKSAQRARARTESFL